MTGEAADRMTADAIETYSRDHGFLAKRLYVIVTTPIDGHDPVQSVSEELLAHQVALERDGVLFAAGPLLTDAGRYCDGEGMIIIRAGSLEEAHPIAARDPMHRDAARSYRLRPWILNEGAIDLAIDLSTGRGVFR